MDRLDTVRLGEHIRLHNGNGKQVFGGTRKECEDWLQKHPAYRVESENNTGTLTEWWRVTTAR